MVRLISADIYKFIKSKSFMVCTIIAVCLTVASVFILDFVQDAMKVVGDGVEMSAQLSKGSYTAASQIGLSLDCDAPLFMAIFLSIFVGMEFNLGTIKNVAARAYSRTQIYLSKLIVSFAGTFVIYVLTILAFLITATALWGFGSTGEDFVPHVLQMYGVGFLLHLAYASVFVMVAMLLRSSGAAIAVSICLQQFVPLAVQLINYFVNRVFKWDVNFSDYLLGSNLGALSSGELTNEVFVRGTVVALVFLVGAAVIGIVTFRKRDIK